MSNGKSPTGPNGKTKKTSIGPSGPNGKTKRKSIGPTGRAKRKSIGLIGRRRELATGKKFLNGKRKKQPSGMIGSTTRTGMKKRNT